MEQEDKSVGRVTKLVIILSIIISAFAIYILLTIELPNKPLAGQGNTINNAALIGGDFILTDQNGNQFDSKKEMRNKLSLVYFGFTYCPDICPTSLQKITDVLNVLDKYQIDVLPIFITVDPARDTSELLKEYLSHFHPKFVGLTGTLEETKKVADLYKVFFARAASQNNNENNYMLDHSSFVYLMSRDGKYMKHFYMSTPPEEIIEYIRINR